jgi:hypothetical protein
MSKRYVHHQLQCAPSIQQPGLARSVQAITEEREARENHDSDGREHADEGGARAELLCGRDVAAGTIPPRSERRVRLRRVEREAQVAVRRKKAGAANGAHPALVEYLERVRALRERALRVRLREAVKIPHDAGRGPGNDAIRRPDGEGHTIFAHGGDGQG